MPLLSFCTLQQGPNFHGVPQRCSFTPLPVVPPAGDMCDLPDLRGRLGGCLGLGGSLGLER